MELTFYNGLGTHLREICKFRGNTLRIHCKLGTNKTEFEQKKKRTKELFL